MDSPRGWHPDAIAVIVANKAAKDWRPKDLPPGGVVQFLESFGFAPAGPESWKSPPSISMQVDIPNHMECLLGHTWYRMECSLYDRFGVPFLEWRTSRRLCQLRSMLHDVVKDQLGASGYAKHFGATKFPHHGGVPGTSKLLLAWMTSMTTVINEGYASPLSTALMLRFLEIPFKSAGLPRPTAGLRPKHHSLIANEHAQPPMERACEAQKPVEPNLHEKSTSMKNKLETVMSNGLSKENEESDHDENPISVDTTANAELKADGWC